MDGGREGVKAKANRISDESLRRAFVRKSVLKKCERCCDKMLHYREERICDICGGRVLAVRP